MGRRPAEEKPTGRGGAKEGGVWEHGVGETEAAGDGDGREGGEARAPTKRVGRNPGRAG